MLYESATGYLCDFIICTGTETLYPSPNVKLPMPFENFKNTSKYINEQASLAFTVAFCFAHAKHNLIKLKLYNN